MVGGILFKSSAPPSRSPKRERKCYITPSFSGVPKQRGIKSELAASPLPSWGPKRERKWCIISAFSGLSNKGDKI